MIKNYLSVVFFLLSFLVHAKPSYMSPGTYFIMDNNVNIREKPNTNSKVVQQLFIGDVLKIIECEYDSTTIGEIEGYWCKIQYKKIEGYVFNYYIANKGLTLDIDENGVNDYVFQKYSSSYYNTAYFNPEKDIVFFLNGEKVILPSFIANPKESYFSCDFYYSSSVSKNAFLIVLAKGFSPDELESYQKDIYLYTENNTMKYFRTVESILYSKTRTVKIEINYPSVLKKDCFSISTEIIEDSEDRSEKSHMIEYYKVFQFRDYYIAKPSEEP